MTPAEYRKAAHEMVDLIADYYETIESRPVLSTVEPGYLAPQLPSECPEEPETWDAVRSDVERVIMPGVTHWQHPNFFAFFPAMSSFPSQLGDMLSGAINCIGFNWLNSPACTELETVVMDWLARLCGLPEHFLSSTGKGGGVIQGTASEATLVAVIAARERRMKKRAAEGLIDEATAITTADSQTKEGTANYVVYGSTQTHSSIKKATMILGCTHGEVRCDPGTGSMDAGALAAMVETDLASGRVPLIVVATLGTTSTGAMDDLNAVAAVCEKHGLWMHVDAAYAGAALCCPELRGFASGLDRADSFNFNCHKWMLVNFDLSAFWVRDRTALLDALSITPSYMRNPASESGLVLDYRDWQIPLGRRFRSLKLWFVLRMYGATGVRGIIREHIRLGKVFESLVREDPRFELPVPSSLSLVCFALSGLGNEANKALVERINADGRIFIIGTEFEGRSILRFVPVAERVTEDHVRKAYASIAEIADGVIKEFATAK